MINMSIKKTLEKFSERKIGTIAGGTLYVTLPKWGKKGQTVIVEKVDENTLTIHKNKNLVLE